MVAEILEAIELNVYVAAIGQILLAVSFIVWALWKNRHEEGTEPDRPEDAGGGV